MLSLMRRHPLWIIVAGGVAIRVVLAFATHGPPSDMLALRTVAEFLDHDLLHAYDVNDGWLGGKEIPAWPYPPAYFPWLLVALGINNGSGLPFHGVIQLLPIAADVAIAIAIHAWLGWRGASERARLAGAALVMLGPSFIAISGYHGQIDSVAILPGVLALMAWERRPARARAVGAGVLVGLGAAVKTFPGLLVLPLLPAARSVAEAARLVATAVAVPLLLFLPFFVADPGAIEWLFTYGGVPGRGGLSLVVQPSLGFDLLTEGVLSRQPTEYSRLVADSSTAVAIATLAVVAVFLLRCRPAPIDGAVLLWLALYALVPNFLMQYIVWGLPFFIMAGYLRQTGIIQAVLLPATVIYYSAGSSGGVDEGLAAIFVATMIGLWAFWVVALVTLATRVARGAGPGRTGVQPPLVRLAGA